MEIIKHQKKNYHRLLNCNFILLTSLILFSFLVDENNDELKISAMISFDRSMKIDTLFSEETAYKFITLKKTTMNHNRIYLKFKKNIFGIKYNYIIDDSYDKADLPTTDATNINIDTLPTIPIEKVEEDKRIIIPKDKEQIVPKIKQ